MMALPNSKTGIVSFVIGVLNLAGLIIFLVYTNYYLEKNFDPDTIIQAVFSSIAVGILYVIILLGGLITGAVSVFQRNTKKLFSILGLVINIIDIFAFFVIAIAVMLMSPGM